jgi:hypothetical protein
MYSYSLEILKEAEQVNVSDIKLRKVDWWTGKVSGAVVCLHFCSVLYNSHWTHFYVIFL